ncbi:MAG: DoxX family protein [Halococcoides sp.]
MASEIQTNLIGQDVSFTVPDRWTAGWLLTMRIVVGAAMLLSGVGKLTGGLTYNAGDWLTGSGPSESVLSWLLVPTGESIPVIAGTLVQYGEIAIGLGLVLGVLYRTATFFGVILMAFFYFGNVADLFNGFGNGYLMWTLLMITLAILGAGRVLGGDTYIESMPFVEDNPRLRYLLG